MSFPINPSDGQQTTVNGVVYTYSTARSAWTVTSSGGSLTSATVISASGNITGANILTGGQVSAVGNVTGDYIFGNGSLLTGISTSATKIFNGTSEANIGASGGNANISIGGTSNVAVFAATGAVITGQLSVSGNVTGGNLLLNGGSGFTIALTPDTLASNTTITLPNSTTTMAGTTTSQTLTNKRIDPRVSATTSSAAAVTPDVSQYDMYEWSAQAATLTINAPIGTPTNGTKLTFRILDDGTPRTISWDPTFTAIGVTLPTTTVANKTVYVGAIYNTANTRWDVVGVAQQA